MCQLILLIYINLENPNNNEIRRNILYFLVPWRYENIKKIHQQRGNILILSIQKMLFYIYFA